MVEIEDTLDVLVVFLDFCLILDILIESLHDVCFNFGLDENSTELVPKVRQIGPVATRNSFEVEPGKRKKAESAKKNLARTRAGSLARGALRARKPLKSTDRFAIGARAAQKLNP